MYYFNYFIKCVIRRVVRLIFKPKFLISILVILSILLIFFNISSHAVYSGDETYTDANLVIFKAYESVCNDFILRLSNSEDNNNKEQLINYINNPQYNYYIYYNEIDGSSMLNGSTWSTSSMWIYIFNTTVTPKPSAIYETYQGLSCSISQIDSYVGLYQFNGNSLINYGRLEPSVTLNMPFNLIAYKSNSITGYLTNPTKESAETVAGAVNNLTNTIKDTNTSEAETETQDTLNSLSTETTSSQNKNSTSLYNFFNDLLNVFRNSVENGSVTELELTLPFVNQPITIPSNLISKHVEGTSLGFLIETSYYFIFGYYIIACAFRIILWFQDGDFIRGKYVPSKTILNDMLM